MKKVLSLAIFAFTTTVASAQINQGQWLVGGNINFSSSKFDDDPDNSGLEDDFNSFQLNPNIGYFFINNFAGGLRLNLARQKFDSDDEAFTRFLAAPFVRYYFLPATQKVNIFADASYGFGTTNEFATNLDDKESVNAWTITAGPAIFLNEHASLEFGLFYSSEGGDAYGEDLRLNTYGINVGFQIHLGARGGGRTTTGQ